MFNISQEFVIVLELTMFIFAIYSTIELVMSFTSKDAGFFEIVLKEIITSFIIANILLYAIYG